MIRSSNIKLKICVLGDSSVGKTSLVQRVVDNTFSDNYIPTIGTTTSKKNLVIKRPELHMEFTIDLMIWDIMGHISFKKLLHPTYMYGANGAILVCDLTNWETLGNLDDWMDSLITECGAVPSIFVANKDDLKDNFQFGIGEVEGMAESYDSNFFLTSAKTGNNVENAFRALGEKIVNNLVSEKNYCSNFLITSNRLLIE
jgi:small GTP-binding protein